MYASQDATNFAVLQNIVFSMSKPKSMGLAKRDARDEVIENFAFKT
jgi:hypothetical protein